jgi:uncharacterized protein with HEPN domain
MSRADPQRLPDYLHHIVDAMVRIRRYVAGLSEPGFMADEKTQDAVVRNFEVIGEAARHVQTQHGHFAAAHPEVPWALMYAMRNRVSHGYFQVDWHLIWMTVHNDLPGLQGQIEALLEGLAPDAC